MRSVLLAVGFLVVLVARASAVTIDQIVDMTKRGVSEPVILAVIERDHTLFTISPEQLVKLQRDGLSDRLLLAMLKSGRDEPAAAAGNATRNDSSTVEPRVEAPYVPAPTVVIVGHGPEYPNTDLIETPAAMDPRAFYPPMIIPVPYLVPHAGRRASHRNEGQLERLSVNPQLCVERIASGSSPFAPALNRVTQCPPQMQRHP